MSEVAVASYSLHIERQRYILFLCVCGKYRPIFIKVDDRASQAEHGTNQKEEAKSVVESEQKE